MKRSFFRVKQLADQTFSRAEKTEVLTDDLQAADKHVEQIKAALTGLSKRLCTPQNLAATQDPAYKEKRLKKCPEYILGQTMLENVSEDGVMSFTLAECGKAQVALANETFEHEAKVEQFVAAPLHRILETDVPNIVKEKRNLARLTLDMDSARTRYQQAHKHSGGGNGATKVDSLREELEEAESKVEQCRDQLAAKMFQLMSRETELAQTIIQYVKLQRAYHESALSCLADLIPGLESYINDNEMKPVYGYPLEEHLRVTNRKIALPIQLCVSALLRLGMEEEGLFRIAGGASKLRRIKLSLDACCLTLPTALEYNDPHVVAGALKSYLRELPEPLLTYKLYPEWMETSKINQIDARLRALWEVLHKLPPANLENLRFLIKFLAVLTKNQDINKMSPQNIAIVIAPNLIWSPQEDTNTMVMNMSTANNSSLIVDQLVTYADWFFPGDIDFDRDLDYRYRIGITNGSDEQIYGVMRRCVSSSSLSDHGESPPQGSPKPATRRKNKPAPTPPSLTPDKHEKRSDDKSSSSSSSPPSAPEKPPRPTANTLTHNRHIHGASKHESHDEPTNHHRRGREKTMENSVEPDAKQRETEITKKNDFSTMSDDRGEIFVSPIVAFHEKSKLDDDCEKSSRDFAQISSEALDIRENSGNSHIKNNPEVEEIENTTLRSRPVPAEKPTSLERKIPIAAPRNLSNATNQNSDDGVELRNKSEIITLSVGDRNNKPAIPERPAGLVRPSSLIRPQQQQQQLPSSPLSTRQSNDVNLDNDSGPLILERAHVYSVDKQQVSIIQVRGTKNPCSEAAGLDGNGNGMASSNLQRSPSVGSRPASMLPITNSERPGKPPRPDTPDQQHAKAHSRTRSEGNIIDVQTQTGTIIVQKSSQQQKPASPRVLQRPPRPQPPPPPPPTGRTKSEQDSTNL